MVYILREASLRDSFLRFQQFFLVFFPPMCPWHLDSKVVGSVPTLLVGPGRYLPDAREVLPIFACTFVVSRWLLVSIVRMTEVGRTRVPFGIIRWAVPL